MSACASVRVVCARGCVCVLALACVPHIFVRVCAYKCGSVCACSRVCVSLIASSVSGINFGK